MNEYPALKAKIDEEPQNAARTDAEVLAWLNELEAGPWIDVGASDFAAWCARRKLPGKLFQARNSATVDDGQSASHMLHQAWTRREGLELSNSDILSHLSDAVQATPDETHPVDNAARDDLVAIAKPSVSRWRNADWSIQPGLGDVEQARLL